MEHSFFVPFVFDENTLSQQVLEPTLLTAKELDNKKRQLMGTLFHEAYAIQLRIRNYKRSSPYDRVYATTNVDPHYEAWVKKHIQLLGMYLRKQYPHLFEDVSNESQGSQGSQESQESQESQDKERYQRVLLALTQLLDRVRSDRSSLESAMPLCSFAEYEDDRDLFQGGLCKFL